MALAEAQAEQWLIQQDADPNNPEQNAAFERWYNLCPENREAYANAELLWQMLGQLDPEQNKMAPGTVTAPSTLLSAAKKKSVDERWVHAGNESAPSQHQKHRKNWRPYASAAVIVLAISGMLWQNTPSAQFSTDEGQQELLTLNDQSKVLLNSDSQLDIAYDNQQRQLNLKQGEALFTVAKDPRPFIVQLGNIQVKALGTIFTVGEHGDERWVSVSESQVEVRIKQEVRQLQAGERLNIIDNQFQPIEKRRLSQISPWQKGVMVAEDLPAEKILSELDRYYPGKILLLNQEIKQRRLNTVLNIRQPEQALNSLALSLKLKARKLGPVTFVY